MTKNTSESCIHRFLKQELFSALALCSFVLTESPPLLAWE
jgi:hypothetical protein